MKSIMIKSVCAVIAVSAVVLACSGNLWNFEKQNTTKIQPVFDKDGYWKTSNFRIKRNKDGKTFSYYGSDSLYGAYLAGRVAHLRHDFDTATEYYKIVLEKDQKNTEINRLTYIILTSIGDINQAAVYAQKEIDNGEKNSLAPVIVAIKNFNDGNYAKSRENIAVLSNQKFHEKVVIPLFDAWSYAGENNETSAVKALDKLSDDAALIPLQKFHLGLIYDYLGNKEKAEENFVYILQNSPQEVTFRMLEIITNFYTRNGNKEKARQISGKYIDDSAFAMLLAEINRQIDNSGTGSPAIINSPQKGLAEVLYNIGTIFRRSGGNEDIAQIYISAAAYLNPSYDISKIAIANIFEENGLLKEANKYYASIDKNSGSYFIARLKLIENLNTLKEYEKAEVLLRQLLKEYPNNTQLLLDLGEIAQRTNKYEEAIEIYRKAISSLDNADAGNWPLFYALGVAYDKSDNFALAEENLQKAVDLSGRNADVLNYLGYLWLSRGKNVDEAVEMIVEAYRQYPYEGHIIDSVGWIYFRLGEYKKSIYYLEQASDINPGNAVISDHLGDAYWFVGRKNEAVFQWRHALDLKEDANVVDRKLIKEKINGGQVKNTLLELKDKSILTNLEDLSQAEEKNSLGSNDKAAK